MFIIFAAKTKRTDMSPRPKHLRRIAQMPRIAGFHPYSLRDTGEQKEPVFLHYEEHEALRQMDYLRKDQAVAAEEMNVSRPTFTRIYKEARCKIATALLEGRQLIIEGGKVCMDEQWHTCHHCHSKFYRAPGEVQPIRCPLCNSNDCSQMTYREEEIDV